MGASDDSWMYLALSAAFALVPALLCYALRWRLGRGPVVPPWMFPTLLLLGAVGGLAMPLTAIGQFDALVADMARWVVRPPFLSSLSGAAAEELGKAVILLAFVPTRWFRSTIDGLLYGFVAGAGFAATENFLYFITAYANDGSPGLANSVIVRLLPSTVIHAGATALVGAFLGAVRWERRLLVIAVAPVLGFILACLLHGGWNSLVVAAAESGEPIYETLALTLLPVTVVALGLVLSAALRIESEVVRDELAPELREGRLTPAELDAVTRPYRRRPGDPLPSGRGRVRFVAAATALAYAHRRARVEGRDARDVDRWRKALEEARAATAPRR